MSKRFSKILNQMIDVQSDKVICADGVIYSRSELDILSKTDPDIKLTLHNLKKIFKGEIIE